MKNIFSLFLAQSSFFTEIPSPLTQDLKLETLTPADVFYRVDVDDNVRIITDESKRIIAESI